MLVLAVVAVATFVEGISYFLRMWRRSGTVEAALAWLTYLNWVFGSLLAMLRCLFAHGTSHPGGTASPTGGLRS
jgi:hypothetical protein